MSNIWINVNYISNWATAIFTVINVLWMVEIIANAVIQKDDLNYYVSKDWKQPLIIMSVLSVIGAGIVYVSTLGVFAFLISLFALVIQLFFMIDYSKMLSKEIEDAWYLKSTYVSLAIIGLTIIALAILFISTIVVTGIGL